MPPVTTTIPGATVVFCALNAAMATSFYGNPTANTIQYTVVSTIEFTQSFTFSSNGVSYTSLHLVGSTTDPNLRKMYYIADGVETLVYHNDQWTDEAYKTITFETQSVREGIYGLLYGQINHINCGVKVQPGTYVWKDNPGTLGSSLYINSFVSGNETFCAATLDSNGERNYAKITVNDSYEGVDIYTNGAWVDEKYKTITIPENCYIGYGKDNDFASLFEATPTISFKHRFKNDTLIGTGTYKFRRYSVEEPVVVKSLEDSTWAEISQVSANKQWDAMGWKVGDTKTITLNGNVGSVALNNYQCKVYILGFDHNSAKEGSGISFALLESTSGKQLSICYFTMNSTNTNSGGWKACNMRKTFLGSTDTANGDATPATTTSPVADTLMAALPTDLRAVLKPIAKYTDNVGNKSTGASSITSTIDYLPLMSEFEVFGRRNYANTNEKAHQMQYQYYADGKSKVRYTHKDVTSSYGWRLRSPSSVDSNSFCLVSDSGGAKYDYAWNGYGMAPVFLV